MNYCFNCFRERSPEDAGACPHCGYNSETDRGKYPYALPQGSILAGRYITGRVLGQGGFGITYLALNVKEDSRCAVKEFFPETLVSRMTGNPQVTAYTDERQEDFYYGLKQFLEEAEILARFRDNPHIVGVHSYFEENGTAYFVMDYVEGDSFKAYIRNQGGKVPWEDAVKILTPVMDALAAVHQQGIVHRDVAPDNIYLAAEGTVKLLDFGAARYSLGDKSKSLDAVRKEGYAPKEQYFRRGRQGPFTDVYSLAACFYSSITGVIPPESVERMDRDGLIPPSRLANLPPDLESVILHGLQVQAENRYQSMAEFRAALDKCLIKRSDSKGPLILPEGTKLNNRYVTGPLQQYNHSGICYIGNLYQVRDERAPTNSLTLLEFFPHYETERKGTTVHGYHQEMFDEGKEIFLRRAKLSTSDSHYPDGRRNITGIYDYFEENNTVYAVLYPEEGTPLPEYLAAHGGKLSFEDAVKLLKPVANALIFYHRLGYVFENAEPRHILVSATGEATLVGLFRDFLDPTSNPPIINRYAAPETFWGKRGKGAYTDVYSLSACIYYTITGNTPPDALNRVQKDELHSPSQLKIRISHSAEKALLKGLAVKAENRYQSITEFLNALNPQIIEKRKTPVLIPIAALIAIALSVFLYRNVQSSYQNNQPYVENMPFTVGQTEGTYTGDWKEGKPEGQGEFSSSDATLVGKGFKIFSYVGEWENGWFSGEGKAVYQDASFYEGHWKGGSRDGYGVYETMFDRYEGNWDSGNRSGEGIQYYGSGAFYDGLWKNNEPEGNGTYTAANGDTFQAVWATGLPTGKTTVQRTDGSSITGIWTGRELVSETGENYVVNRECSAIVVFNGKRNNVSGDYTGTWRNGRPDGPGSLVSGSLLTYTGTWEGGRLEQRTE